ncbi:MAG: GlsB/YeaQ/YmgE family stress response membrane protein [Acidobacteriota bacterium]
MGIGWLIGQFISGLIIGAIARFLLPGKDEMGCLATAGVGIAGSAVGTFIGYYFHLGKGGFISSVLCTILLLWIWRKVQSREA